LVVTGVLWGCTNPFIRQGTKGLRSVKAETWLGQAYAEIIFLLGNWRYVVPFLVNQCGSLVYLMAVQRAPLSLAVPASNSLAFAFTAVTGSMVGAEEPLDRGLPFSFSLPVSFSLHRDLLLSVLLQVRCVRRVAGVLRVLCVCGVAGGVGVRGVCGVRGVRRVGH
ncbi:Transmembrane protein 234-like, partial [Papilio machaon]